ncbi:thiamine pyrophosphate-dependent enzyme [Escherichia coli]
MAVDEGRRLRDVRCSAAPDVLLHFIIHSTNRVAGIDSGGLGTMGFRLPPALGVKMALPEETVVCVTGDGGVQMNAAELSTALQYELPVLVVN